MTNEPFTEETTGQIDPQNPFDNALENARTGRIPPVSPADFAARLSDHPCSRSVTSAGTFAAR